MLILWAKVLDDKTCLCDYNNLFLEGRAALISYLNAAFCLLIFPISFLLIFVSFDSQLVNKQLCWNLFKHKAI